MESRTEAAGRVASAARGNKTHIVQVRVRWGETDTAGIVYFAKYLTYFELGEVELLRSLGKSQRELSDQLHVRFPRVEAHCRYRASAQWDDLLEIHTRIGELTTRALTFAHEIYRQPDHKLLADGWIRIMCVSRNDRSRAIELPPAFVQYLGPYVP